jgi:pimeloyl-ACP methyl ester carboxylesterase
MGGTAAYLYAERHPDRLAALVLEDTPAPRYRSTMPIPDQPPADLPFDWPLVPALFARLADPDPAWWDGLVKITAPTLVLAGGPTSHVAQDLLAEAADRIPDSQVVTVKGTGHDIHRDHPAGFLAHLSAFLAERG